MSRPLRSAKAICTASIVSLLLGLAGCGVVPPLPNAAPNLTLQRLRELQRDERLTQDEKREMLRGLLGVADDEEGNRLANLLLGLNITNLVSP